MCVRFNFCSALPGVSLLALPGGGVAGRWWALNIAHYRFCTQFPAHVLCYGLFSFLALGLVSCSMNYLSVVLATLSAQTSFYVGVYNEKYRCIPSDGTMWAGGSM